MKVDTANDPSVSGPAYRQDRDALLRTLVASQ
jgi:hypothetical protein